MGAVSIQSGDVIKLSCKVTAQPEPEVKWYKDDKKIKEKKDKCVKIGKDGDLFFLEVTTATIEDGGKYTIKATNEGGSVAHDVTVMVQEAVVKAQPVEEEVEEEKAPEVESSPSVAPEFIKKPKSK